MGHYDDYYDAREQEERRASLRRLGTVLDKFSNADLRLVIKVIDNIESVRKFFRMLEDNAKRF